MLITDIIKLLVKKEKSVIHSNDVMQLLVQTIPEVTIILS